MGSLKFVGLSDGVQHVPPVIEKLHPIPNSEPITKPPINEKITKVEQPITEVKSELESVEKSEKPKSITGVKKELSYPIKFKKIIIPKQINVESEPDKSKPNYPPTSQESLYKKKWFRSILIPLLLISSGIILGWYLSTFNKENYKHKLIQSLSLLEVETKQSANLLKKNVDMQNEYQLKLASLLSESINLNNIYQSNLLVKDNEIKFIKNNLTTNFIFNTITNTVTNTVTNKIPTQIEKFKIDLIKKIGSIVIAYNKETESEDVYIEKLQKLEKNKKILEEIIVDIDRVKEKQDKEINAFIESKVKHMISKGIGYGTNKSIIKLK